MTEKQTDRDLRYAGSAQMPTELGLSQAKAMSYKLNPSLPCCMAETLEPSSATSQGIY